MCAEPRRKLDYSYILATPDDGKRYQLIEGELEVTPAPSPQHQRVSKRLQRQLEAYFEERSLGEVFNAPIDLILTEHDVLGPDIVVVADPAHVSSRGIERPPLLVVEVLSPSTRRFDEGRKARRYAELGVQHYWIVDPDPQRVICHRRAGERFERVVEFRGDVRLTHPDFAGLELDLAAIWA